MTARSALAILAAAAALGSPAAASAASWVRTPLPVPEGGQVEAPAGTPMSLVAIAPNRVLLATAGNAATPKGLLSWDGTQWRQLATVCGGPIVVAGPSDFWTITDPSFPRTGINTALCHFSDGVVVGSYSTRLEDPDAWSGIARGACVAPADCLFAGGGTRDPTGQRAGGFHLRWDGASLTTIYAPQGRLVSDIVPDGAGYVESMRIAALGGNEPPVLAEPETIPRLLHDVAPGPTFGNDPFAPAERPGLSPDGTELWAMDPDGARLWAAGGAASSGPNIPSSGHQRPPLLLVREPGQAWREVPIPNGEFTNRDVFVDVAAVPGTDAAWVALRGTPDTAGTSAPARVALIAADGTVLRRDTVPGPEGAPRGRAQAIECAAVDDCWLATAPGWIYHYTDGGVAPRDTDPAFQTTITQRPNESVEQPTPDSLPVDDSLLFAPAPPEIPSGEPQTPPPAAKPKRLSALVKSVKKPRLRPGRRDARYRTLVVTFTVTRAGKVGLVGKRRGKVVARTKARALKPGKRSLTLRVDRRHWPKSLAFTIVDPQAPKGGSGASPGIEDPNDVIATRAAPVGAGG